MLLLILGGRQRLALAVLCGSMVPYAALLGLAARYGGAHAVAFSVVAGVWGIFLALAIAVRKCLGIWIFATPSAAWRLLRRRRRLRAARFARLTSPERGPVIASSPKTSRNR